MTPLVTLPQRVWNLLVRVLPSVDRTCEQAACHVPGNALVFYFALVGSAIVFAVVLKNTGETDPDANGDTTETIEGKSEDTTQRVDSTQPDSVTRLFRRVEALFSRFGSEDDTVSTSSSSDKQQSVEGMDTPRPNDGGEKNRELDADGHATTDPKDLNADEAIIIEGGDSPLSVLRPDVDPVGFFDRLLGRSDNTEEHTVEFSFDALGDRVDADGQTPPAGDKAESVLNDINTDPESDVAHSGQVQKIASPGIDEGWRTVQTGEAHRQTLLIESWGDNIKPGVLMRFFESPSLNFDLSIHFRPQSRSRNERRAKTLVQNLEGESRAVSTNSFQASDKQLLSERARRYRNEINDGARPFKASGFISVRGGSEEDLRENVDKLLKLAEQESISLSAVSGDQVPALESVAPLCRDYLGEMTGYDTSKHILSPGVGAILASGARATHQAMSGQEIGEHAVNNSPVIVDPFDTETNYNKTVIGESGSGKSFHEKQEIIRAKASREDLMVVMLDPLDGFEGVAEAIDAEKIVMDGGTSINPMELRRPPENVTESAQYQQNVDDPLEQKIKEVKSFFENYAARELSDGFADPVLLDAAIKFAYKDPRIGKAITSDISTHPAPDNDQESPTVDTIIAVLEDMESNPSKYVIASENTFREDNIEKNAGKIIQQLRGFVDGSYQNFNGKSEVDLESESLYLSLPDGEIDGLMLQLMFSLTYQRAKEYEGEVIFVIDEARYLMRDAENLDFLAQRVRQTRHYDTSLRFITQEMDDFFQFEAAEGIVNNSAFLTIHRTKGIKDYADRFDLEPEHLQFVENAATGAQENYSECLMQIDGRWFPIRITPAGEAELAVIDFDEQEDSLDTLPGRGGKTAPPLVTDIRDRMRAGNPSLGFAVKQEVGEGLWPLIDMLSEPDLRMVLDRMSGSESQPPIPPEQALKEQVVAALTDRMERLLDNTKIEDDQVEQFLNRVSDALWVAVSSAHRQAQRGHHPGEADDTNRSTDEPNVDGGEAVDKSDDSKDADQTEEAVTDGGEATDDSQPTGSGKTDNLTTETGGDQA